MEEIWQWVFTSIGILLSNLSVENQVDVVSNMSTLALGHEIKCSRILQGKGIRSEKA